MLIYSLCFYHYQCSPSSTMLVESLDDGLTWSAPRNLSDQLGVRSFIPGPGFGIQVYFLDGFMSVFISLYSLQTKTCMNEKPLFFE